MAKTNHKSADEYIGAQPKDVQEKLQRIRQTVHEAVPEAEEVISYQLPAYKCHDFVLYFGAFTNHISVSSPPPTFAAFKEKLAPYKVWESAAQFPFDKPIPYDLITEIAQSRQRRMLPTKITNRYTNIVK